MGGVDGAVLTAEVAANSADNELNAADQPLAVGCDAGRSVGEELADLGVVCAERLSTMSRTRQRAPLRTYLVGPETLT